MRPENFEKITKELLIKMGYHDVTVTQFVKDGGVDVIAYKKMD